MTAGRGIVHSERTAAEQRATGAALFGIQAWAALPKSHEETAPAFAHHAQRRAAAHHRRGQDACASSMGSAYGARSPVAFPHATLFAEAVLAPGAVLPLDADYDERAVYVASGEIDVAGDASAPGGCSCSGQATASRSWRAAQSRLMLLGGEPMDGPRHIWWNFVSSSKERIDASQGRLEREAIRRWCRATRRSSFRFPEIGLHKIRAPRRGAGALDSTARDDGRRQPIFSLALSCAFWNQPLALSTSELH